MGDSIAEPRYMNIPSQQKMDEVFEHLTPEGRQDFIAEVTVALTTAQEDNDLSLLEHTVNAWWVSMLFLNHPQIDAAFAAAEADDSPPMTASQVGELLGVA